MNSRLTQFAEAASDILEPSAEQAADKRTEFSDPLLAISMAAAKPVSEADWLKQMSEQVDIAAHVQSDELKASANILIDTIEERGTSVLRSHQQARLDLSEMIGLVTDMGAEFSALADAAAKKPSHVRPLKLNAAELAEALDLVQTILAAAYPKKADAAPKTKAAAAPTPARRAGKPGPANS